MEVNISTSDMCLIISLITVCSGLTSDTENFERINKELYKSIGISD